MRLRISIRGSVHPSVRPFVRPSVGPSVGPVLFLNNEKRDFWGWRGFKWPTTTTTTMMMMMILNESRQSGRIWCIPAVPVFFFILFYLLLLHQLASGKVIFCHPTEDAWEWTWCRWQPVNLEKILKVTFIQRRRNLFTDQQGPRGSIRYDYLVVTHCSIVKFIILNTFLYKNPRFSSLENNTGRTDGPTDGHDFL